LVKGVVVLLLWLLLAAIRRCREEGRWAFINSANHDIMDQWRRAPVRISMSTTVFIKQVTKQVKMIFGSDGRRCIVDENLIGWFGLKNRPSLRNNYLLSVLELYYIRCVEKYNGLF